jgi:electron transport complex protein RnfD
MTENRLLLVQAAPHLHKGLSTSQIMWSVSLCLLPAGIWGIYLFGIYALFTVCASILAAVLTELIVTAVQGKITLFDGSAFLTGLLIGYNMPPEVPGFIPIMASVFAILVVKHAFGGLGRNWMNPALAGRAFVMFSWTSFMTSWTPPQSTDFMTWLGLTRYQDVVSGASYIDILSGATPLAKGPYIYMQVATYWDLFMGNTAGCIGEVSAFLLILGSVYLFIRKIIAWQIPLSYLAVFTFFTLIFGGLKEGLGLFQGDILFHLFSGGLMLGALYMATDMVTSPLTGKGQIIFGAGAGFLTFLIRFYSGLPEGVSMAILLMNICVPLIDRFTKPVKFGLIKEVKNETGK